MLTPTVARNVRGLKLSHSGLAIAVLERARSDAFAMTCPDGTQGNIRVDYAKPSQKRLCGQAFSPVYKFLADHGYMVRKNKICNGTPAAPHRQRRQSTSFRRTGARSRSEYVLSSCPTRPRGSSILCQATPRSVTTLDATPSPRPVGSPLPHGGPPPPLVALSVSRAPRRLICFHHLQTIRPVTA